ncbi:MAG: TolC family protein [Bacteroidaceae bacterium]|nr:TolC family protein [Bacteroidaceae bacterium]
MIKNLATLAALALSTMGLHAQQTWTLQQCLDYAAEHNIQVQKSRITEQEAEQTLLQSKAALFPSLSASVSQGLSYRPFQEATTIVQNGMATTSNKKVTENGSYGVNASWTIWDGGVNRKNIEAARLAGDIAATQTAQSLNTIQEQIAQLYVQILYTTESCNVNSQLAATAQQQLDRARERYAVGDLARADVAQLESQLAQAKYDVVNAQTQVAGYKRQLKELLQIDISQEFDVAGEELSDERAMALVPDKQEVYNAALQQRPEIRAAELQTQSADLQLNIAKRGYLPTIGMSAGIGDSHYTASEESFGEQMKRNLNGSVGLNISVPIFDNRRTRTAIEKAKLQRTNAQLDLINQQTTLGSNIENIWLQATTAQQRFVAAKVAVESQETNYELINEQFKAGLKNIVDLLQARDNLLQAQQSRLQSKYTTILNTQLLHFYEGGIMGL